MSHYAWWWTGQKKRPKMNTHNTFLNAPGHKAQATTYLKDSQGMWTCAHHLLDPVFDGVTSVARGHWIQFSSLRFFLLLEFASKVRNLVMNHCNDRSQTKSWQHCRSLLIWSMVSESEFQRSYDGFKIHWIQCLTCIYHPIIYILYILHTKIYTERVLLSSVLEFKLLITL